MPRGNSQNHLSLSADLVERHLETILTESAARSFANGQTVSHRKIAQSSSGVDRRRPRAFIGDEHEREGSIPRWHELGDGHAITGDNDGLALEHEIEQAGELGLSFVNIVAWHGLKVVPF